MGVRGLGHGAGRARGGVTSGLRRLRATTRRDGADRSGLAPLLDLSVIDSAGNALVTVALAASLFFSVPTGEARSKVALYLLITMVPFVLLAPVIGPLLDRVAHGRRTALAALFLARGLLAWQLANKLSGLAVYPLALGLLMLTRAFGVARSAVIPRVAPPELTLVKVNSRMSTVNIVAGTIAAPVGLGIANIPYVGYPWVLRLCALLYMAGVLSAFNLPKKVDSNDGERGLREVVADATGPRAAQRAGRARLGFRVRVRALAHAVLGASPVALRSTLVLRSIVGFLTFYLAFLLRAEGGTNLWLGALAASAALGSGLGVFIGGRLGGRRRPERLLTLALLLTTAGCVLAAADYAKVTALFAALLAMLAASMAKLALDAMIQRDTAEDNRNSAFARSETLLQLGWVLGGACGLIEMPGPLGFLAAAALAGLAMFGQAREIRRVREVGAIPGTAAWPEGEPWPGETAMVTMMPPPGGEPDDGGGPAGLPPTVVGPAVDPPGSDAQAQAALGGERTLPTRRGRRPWNRSRPTPDLAVAQDPNPTLPLGSHRPQPVVPPPRPDTGYHHQE